jgi:hypothetical protein
LNYSAVVQALSDREVAPGLLGPVLFALLLAASVVVAAVVVHARSPNLALEVTRWPNCPITPNGDRKRDVAHIAFYVRESDPGAMVEIVGPNLEAIRVLAAHRSLVADRRVTFTWNGRTQSGALANPRDRYRLRVVLPSQDRDMIYTRKISIYGPCPPKSG